MRLVRGLKRTADQKMTDVTRRFPVCCAVNKGGCFIVFRVNHGCTTSTMMAWSCFLSRSTATRFLRLRNRNCQMQHTPLTQFTLHPYFPAMPFRNGFYDG